MVSAVLLLVGFALDRATAVRISHQEIKQLENERERFVKKTSELPDSGYTYGGEGSDHWIIFPIGRSDVLYFVASVLNLNDDGKGHSKQTTSFTITKWTAAGRAYKKQWQLPFKDSLGGKPPTGTLAAMAFESKFRPDTTSPAWPLAKPDLEQTAPYAYYTFGEHGDVSLQAFAKVYDAKNHQLAEKWLGQTTNHRFDETYPVLPAEVKLMQAARKRPASV